MTTTRASSDPLQAIAVPMALALQANFGSAEHWCDEFVAMQREHGAATLAFRPSTGSLVNAPALGARDARGALARPHAGRRVVELRDADRPVLVYCVYGHEVGRATALRLRAAGIEARFLRGGIDGWQSAGRALDAKETAS